MLTFIKLQRKQLLLVAWVYVEIVEINGTVIKL